MLARTPVSRGTAKRSNVTTRLHHMEGQFLLMSTRMLRGMGQQALSRTVLAVSVRCLLGITPLFRGQLKRIFLTITLGWGAEGAYE